MSFFANFFGKKHAQTQPNLRPRSGNSVFNLMVLAASCTGGYVLFHTQRRELEALYAENEKNIASPESKNEEIKK